MLGHYPEVSLIRARQLAREKRKSIGLEPPNGYTFNDAFRLWCNLKRNRITSYKEEKRRLYRHVFSKIGNRQIDEITAPLMIATVKPLESKGHQSTLKRVLLRTREVLDLAVCAGYIHHNPIDRLSRIFAQPDVSHMPTIHWRELPRAFEVMSKAPRQTQLLFLWSCLTLLRPKEAVIVRTDWIDEDVLTIPPEKMKMNRPHRVPLTPVALKVLEHAKALSGMPRSPLIWISRRTKRELSEQTLARYLHRSELSGRLVAHGIRSIGRSWFADHGAPFEAAEACLSHITGNAVSRAYQRSDYLELRRSLMTQWNAYVTDCARCAGFLPEITSVDNGLT